MVILSIQRLFPTVRKQQLFLNSFESLCRWRYSDRQKRLNFKFLIIHFVHRYDLQFPDRGKANCFPLWLLLVCIQGNPDNLSFKTAGLVSVQSWLLLMLVKLCSLVAAKE